MPFARCEAMKAAPAAAVSVPGGRQLCLVHDEEGCRPLATKVAICASVNNTLSAMETYGLVRVWDRPNCLKGVFGLAKGR